MASGLDIGFTGGVLGLLAAIDRISAYSDNDLEMAKLFVRNAEEPAAIVGTDEKVIICNSHMESFLGRTEAELRMMQFSEFTLNEFRDIDVELFHKVLDPTVDFDKYALTKGWLKPDHTPVFGLLKVWPVVRDGEVVFTFVIVIPQSDEQPDKIQPIIMEAKDNLVIQALKEFAKSASPLKLMAAVFGFMMGLALMWNFGRIFDLLETVFSSGATP